jgi:hypothetical protein
MKVILTAFGKKLTSSVLEWPENTTDRIRLPLDMDVLKASPQMDGTRVPDLPTMKCGTFEWTGYFLHYPDSPSAREYVLVDIS